MKMKNAAKVMVAATVVAAAALAPAQTSGVFGLTWSTVDSGGGLAVGDGYKLAGVIGQPEAGSPSTGGVFTLTPGFLQESSYAPPSAVSDWGVY